MFVMERQQKLKLKQRLATASRGKEVACRDIPDRFEFMQPELSAVLQQKSGHHLRERNRAEDDRDDLVQDGLRRIDVDGCFRLAAVVRQRTSNVAQGPEGVCHETPKQTLLPSAE